MDFYRKSLKPGRGERYVDEEERKRICPVCGFAIIYREGCRGCPNCGYSFCEEA